VVTAPGYLSINSSPWARVLVDGRAVGTTPQVRIRVTAGRHHLSLVREGFQAHTAWVTVPAGGTVRLTDITLSKITQRDCDLWCWRCSSPRRCARRPEARAT